MGYFDGLTQKNFNKDQSGRNLFFLSRWFGKAYVFDDNVQYLNFVDLIKRQWVFLCVLCIFFWALISLPILSEHFSDVVNRVFIGATILWASISYYIIKVRLRPLNTENRPFNVKQGRMRAIHAYGLPALIVLQICSLLYIAGWLYFYFSMQDASFLPPVFYIIYMAFFVPVMVAYVLVFVIFFGVYLLDLSIEGTVEWGLLAFSILSAVIIGRWILMLYRDRYVRTESK